MTNGCTQKSIVECISSENSSQKLEQEKKNGYVTRSVLNVSWESDTFGRHWNFFISVSFNAAWLSEMTSTNRFERRKWEEEQNAYVKCLWQQCIGKRHKYIYFILSPQFVAFAHFFFFFIFRCYRRDSLEILDSHFQYDSEKWIYFQNNFFLAIQRYGTARGTCLRSFVAFTCT